MKTTKSWKGMVAAALLAVVSCGVMAEDVVQERFRKALFAEESDQDLAEAVRGYEAVLEGAETPLRTAATALYRLGECHRKLGRTNEAAAAFGRLAREFPGQTNLVRLARQNLVALGKGEPASGVLPSSDMGASGVAESNPAAQKAQADLAEAARIEAVLDAAKDPGSRSVRDILEAGLPTPELIQQKRRILVLIHQLEDAVGRGLKTDTEEYQRLELQVKVSEKDYARELDQLGQRKKLEAELLRRGAEAQLQALGVGAATATTARDPEDVEIDRLKALEKDSPDLIRRGPPGGVSPIEDAVGKGQVRVVEFLLGKGIPASGLGGSSPLLDVAVRNGRLSMVDLLLKRGADVNTKASGGSPPLHAAIANRFPAIVQRLLEAKPDLETVSGSLPGLQSSSALGLAVQIDDLALVKRLLEMGAKPKGVLRLAAQSHDPTILKTLIQAGLDPKTDPEAYSALHAAVLSMEAKPMLQLLVDSGVDINLVQDNFPPALHWAINSKRSTEQLVSNVLSLGADPNQASKGVTPLGLALQLAKIDVVRMLLEKGADPKSPGVREAVPVVIRAYEASRSAGDLGILEAVLSKGGRPDEFHGPPIQGVPKQLLDRTEMRALDIAAALGDVKAVRLLLAHGSSATLRNSRSRTVLRRLQEEQAGNPYLPETVRSEIRKVLLEAGAPDPTDPKAGGLARLYLETREAKVVPVGPVEWPKGESRWVSEVVAEHLKGRFDETSSIVVVRGAPGQTSSLRVDLTRVRKPGDPGDIELLDLDAVQVPERPKVL
jgi:ankyrin repeat protein